MDIDPAGVQFDALAKQAEQIGWAITLLIFLALFFAGFVAVVLRSWLVSMREDRQLNRESQAARDAEARATHAEWRDIRNSYAEQLAVSHGMLMRSTEVLERIAESQAGQSQAFISLQREYTLLKKAINEQMKVLHELVKHELAIKSEVNNLECRRACEATQPNPRPQPRIDRIGHP
jgi:hypothetical protein